MTIAAYVQVTHAFPAVLEKLHLPAFDMSKIISTFVRHLAPADQVKPLALDPNCVSPTLAASLCKLTEPAD